MRRIIEFEMNLLAALAEITEYWSPRVVGRVNDQYIKVAKVKGELAWHRHDVEDEMFLVFYGRLVIQFESGEVALNPGDFHVVPKGTLHNPVAAEECGIALIETVTTLHTGSTVTPQTRSIADQLKPVESAGTTKWFRKLDQFNSEKFPPVKPAPAPNSS